MAGEPRPFPVSVAGLSLLRQNEIKPKIITEEQKAREAYLAKMYGGGDRASGLPGETTKKKKKKKLKPVLGGVRIIDKDVSGFGAATARDSEEDEEFLPVVADVEGAEREIRRAEMMRDGRHLAGWEVADRDGHRRHSPDASPPRQARHDSEDASPPRRTRHDSPDASPPRRTRHDSPDATPPRRTRQDSPDASPPRRTRHDSPDASPPRRTRHDSPDASPPRRTRHDTADASPPRRTRHDSPDASPPRRTRQDSPDASPPRRTRHDSPDASPPRRTQGGAKDAVGDASPPRKRRAEDASPPRRGGAAAGQADAQTAAAAKKAKFMSDGTVAGKVSGQEVMAEMERKRAVEKERFAKMDASQTGRGAQTVYRDKQGRIVDEEELKRLREADKKPQAEAPTWGAGIKQMRDAEERQKEMEREAAKPFARRADDPELDAMYRERVRFGDPMAHLVKKRAGGDMAPPVVPEHVAKQMKKRGFVIPQEVPPHSWIKRGLGAPINRYNIRPGRHWDGVVRSNGFERDMFATRNARSALATEAFMWSQSDM